jgi:small-conductance mechanosensitive channel
MSHHATVALIVLAAGLVAILIVDRVMQRGGKRVVEHLPVADQAVFATRYRLLRRVSEAVIILIAVIIVLWSFDSTRSAAQTVLASSAVLGLVVGFAARSTLANFVAGVMIAINQPVRLGDRVCVGDAEGTVEDIGLAYTRLRTPDNRRVLIPNEELANSRVTNMTIIDPVSLAQVKLTLPPAADPARVRPILEEQAGAVAGRLLDHPGPGYGVADVTAEGTTFSVGVWMPDAAQAAVAAAALRERCLARLHEEGIVAEAVTEPATG